MAVFATVAYYLKLQQIGKKALPKPIMINNNDGI